MGKTAKPKLNKLQPVQLKKLPPGAHGDGNGLYLVVQPSGSRAWMLRTTIHGRRRDIGLGGLATRTLAEAREEASKLRTRARKGEDVLAARRAEKNKTNCPTFEEAAGIVHKEVAPALKNEHNKFMFRFHRLAKGRSPGKRGHINYPRMFQNSRNKVDHQEPRVHADRGDGRNSSRNCGRNRRIPPRKNQPFFHTSKKS